MKRFLLIAGLFFLTFTVVYAAPTATILRTILPETTNMYDLGSLTKGWKRLFIATSTAGCVTAASTGELYSVGSACGSGSGSSTFGTTSLSSSYPILWNTSTAVLSLDFGTTTSNTWVSTQTFNSTTHNSHLSLDQNAVIRKDLNLGDGQRTIFNATSTNTLVGRVNQSATAFQGADNTLVGYGAWATTNSGSRNVAVGSTAGGSATFGGPNDNVLLGYTAGKRSRGDGNILVGSMAGTNLLGGAYNIGIGSGVDFGSNSADQQLNIGNLLYGAGIYNSTTPSADVTNGKIGVGTTSPYARLSVAANNGETNTTLFAIASSTASATKLLFSIDNTGLASTTYLYGANLVSCTAGSFLTWVGGLFGCAADQTGSGSAFPFTAQTYGNSTSTVLNFATGFMSTGSSTVQELKIGNATSTNATTTNLYVSGQLRTPLSTGLVLSGSTGVLSNYAGSACTNQFVRALDASGAATCATVGTADVAGLDISDDTNLASTWPVILTGDTLSFGGLSTSTAAVIGNIPYFSGVNTFANVATSTLTATSPLTGSFTHVGTTGSLGCQTVSGTQAGCLSAADWLTFNNKIGTSSNATAGNLAYFTTTNGTPALIADVATGTVSGTNGVTVTAGRSAIGGALAIDCTVATKSAAGCLPIVDWNTFNGKVATSASETAGQLAAWGTTSGTPPKLYSVATSSLGVTGPITFSGTLGSQIGGAGGSFGCATCVLTTRALTVAGTANQITSSAGAQDLSADRTWTLSLAGPFAFTTASGLMQGNGTSAMTGITGTVGQFPYYNGTNTLLATSSLILATSNNVGIGSTTPWAKLSVDTANLASGVPSFSIGSTTRTDMVVMQSGFFGFGTTSPDKKFTLEGIVPAAGGSLAVFRTTGSNNGAGLQLDAAGSGNNNLIFSVSNVAKAGIGYDVSRGILGSYNAAYSANDYSMRVNSDGSFTYNDGVTGNELFRVTAGGKVGIATSTPNNLLDLYSTSKAAIGFSGASGSTYKWTIGMDVTNAGRFSIASSTALGTTDRFVIDGAGNVGIGTTSPLSLLSIQGANANATVNIGTWAGNASYSSISLNGGNNLGANFYSSVTDQNLYINRPTGNTINFRANNVDQMVLSSGGNFGIGTTTPGTLLSIGNTTGVNFTVATTTFATTGGVNLTGGGCFAVSGRCTNDKVGFAANISAYVGVVRAIQYLATTSAETYDSGGYFNDAATGNKYAWTPPGGTVLMTCGALWDGSKTVTAGRAFIGYIYKNGVSLEAFLVYSQGASQYLKPFVTVLDRANGTDYYQCFVEQQDSVNQDVLSGRFAGVVL